MHLLSELLLRKFSLTMTQAFKLKETARGGSPPKILTLKVPAEALKGRSGRPWRLILQLLIAGRSRSGVSTHNSIAWNVISGDQLFQTLRRRSLAVLEEAAFLVLFGRQGGGHSGNLKRARRYRNLDTAPPLKG